MRNASKCKLLVLTILCSAILIIFSFVLCDKTYAVTQKQVVQTINFSTDKIVGGNNITVTMVVSNDVSYADNFTLYLEGKLNDSNYTQITVNMNKIAGNVYNGVVVTRFYDAGRTYYPSFLFINDINGNEYMDASIKSRFPNCSFKVFANEDEMNTEYITLSPGGISSEQSIKFTSSSVSFDNTLYSISVDDPSIASILRSGSSFSYDGENRLYFYIQGLKTGNTKITIVDLKTGSIYKKYNVTVNEPEIKSRVVCVGETISEYIEYNNSTNLYGFSSQNISYEPGRVTVDNEYASVYDNLTTTNSQSFTHKSGTFYTKVYTPGSYNLYLWDGNRNLIKTISLTVQEHQYDSVRVIQKKTCKDHEIREYTCVRCGATKQEESTDFSEHQWKEDYTIDKQPTCVEEGVKSIHCSYCDTIQDGSEIAIEKVDHTYGNWTVTKNATCTADGSKEKTCEVCGDTVTEVIPSLGHAFSEDFTIDRPASCTTDGSKSKHCARCDEVSDVTAIPATGHNFGEWVEVKPSTCEDEGFKKRTCDICGSTETENINPKGHDFDVEYTIDVQATCTKDGSKSKHCKNCKAATDSVVIPATGHSYGEWITTKEATCVNTGIKERKCSVCKVKETEELPLTDHTWEDDPTIDKKPTCTEPGSQSNHCKYCKETTNYEVIPATGHNWNEVEYEWADDYSFVTAFCTCKNDRNHMETEIADTTSKITKAATYSAMGQTTYTALFTNPLFEEQTKTITNVPKVPLEAKYGEDGTPTGKGASYQAAEKAILGLKKDADPSGSKVAPLFLRSTKQTKKSLTLTWKRPTGAKKFVIYGNQCGKTKKIKKIMTTTKTKVSIKKAVKKIVKGKYYKFVVVSLDKNNNVVSTSKMLHIATKGGKVGNFKKVTTKAKNNKVTIKKGKSFKLTGKGVPQSKKLKVKAHVAIRYESANSAVATVTGKGVVKGVKKGSTYVYAYSQNGAYAKIKVTVK